MSEDLERRDERRELRVQRRELAKEKRHLVRTTRVRTIPVPIGRMADLFAAIHRRNEDFRYAVTGPDTMTATVVGFPIVIQQLGPAVALRFEAASDDSTTITATVPDIAYLLGNGHLLEADVVLKFIEEGAERWNGSS